MTHQHCWVTTDPTGGDPWMGGPVTIVVCADCGREQMDRPNAYEQGQRDALAGAVQRVEALPHALECVTRDTHYNRACNCLRGDALDAISGDQP
jgi:hypothetical protein